MRPRWIWLLVVTVPAILIYRGTTGFGFFSDDFQWLVGARQFRPAHLTDIAGRDHFYRPVLEMYFPAALAACGRSSVCFHWINIALHAATGLLLAWVAAALSRRASVGTLAGLLFVVQPGPVEAVTWISAVSEVATTLLFILTVGLFRHWLEHGGRGWWALAFVTFTACLLTHESGVTLLPVLGLMAWMTTYADAPPVGARRLAAALAPFALVLAAYLAIAVVINSRNYLITGGGYSLGPHVWTNIAGALVTLSVATRGALGYLLVGAGYGWAIAAAPARVRFYALWTLVTLSPFVLFEQGLASRYLYLPAAGFAAMLAEILCLVRRRLEARGALPLAAWWLVAIFVVVRFGVFAEKNVHNWAGESQPYRDYAAAVRQRHPNPAPGAVLDVPPPPAAIPNQYLEPLIQWEFDAPGLRIRR